MKKEIKKLNKLGQWLEKHPEPVFGMASLSEREMMCENKLLTIAKFFTQVLPV